MKKYFIILVIFLASCQKEETDYVIYDEPLIDIDGNTYKTVKIGDQIWMAENLRTMRYKNGEIIPQIRSNNWTRFTSPAQCYYEGVESTPMGVNVLYNCWAINDKRNIAPDGWHISTLEDWQKLETYIKSKIGSNASVGKTIAAVFGWKESDKKNAVGNNQSKNDIYGFDALPVGYRDVDGSYGGTGQYAYFWIGNGKTGSSAYIMWMSGELFIDDTSNEALYGYTIRCVKDSN